MFGLLLAYLLTGLACIIWDHRMNFHDRPAYARRIQRLPIGGAVVLLGWLPMRLIQAQRTSSLKSVAKPLATFFILAAGASWL